MAPRNNPIPLLILASLAWCMSSQESIYSFKESGCEVYYGNISNNPEIDAKINLNKGNVYYLNIDGVSIETPGVESVSGVERRTIPGTSDSGCLFFSRSAKIYAERYNKYIYQRLNARR